MQATKENKFYGNPMIGWFYPALYNTKTGLWDKPDTDKPIICGILPNGDRQFVWSSCKSSLYKKGKPNLVKGIEWKEVIKQPLGADEKNPFHFYPHLNGKKLIYDEGA